MVIFNCDPQLTIRYARQQVSCRGSRCSALTALRLVTRSQIRQQHGAEGRSALRALRILRNGIALFARRRCASGSACRLRPSGVGARALSQSQRALTRLTARFFFARSSATVRTICSRMKRETSSASAVRGQRRLRDTGSKEKGTGALRRCGRRAMMCSASRVWPRVVSFALFSSLTCQVRPCRVGA